MKTFKPLTELLNTLPPERLAKIEAEAAKMSAAIRLAEIRKSQHLTQGEIAKKMGVSQASISKIEQRGNVQLDTLTSYAHALGFQVNIDFVDADGKRQQVMAR